METDAKLTARTIDVTGLSDEAIRAVESIVSILREVQNGNGGLSQDSTDSVVFERGLDELTEGLPPLCTLPKDFSRADIYGEHA